MASNPFEAILKACDSLARGVHAHLSTLFPAPNDGGGSRPSLPLIAVSTRPSAGDDTSSVHPKLKSATPLTKEELGRATWTLLHTIAAQFPDNPTRQQRRDAKELMAILSRLYPCKECADHFKEVLKANPVQAGSQADFSQWLCHVHNVVNRSLGKVTFPCQRVNARWGKLDCLDRACDLQGSSDISNLR